MKEKQDEAEYRNKRQTASRGTHLFPYISQHNTSRLLGLGDKDSPDSHRIRQYGGRHYRPPAAVPGGIHEFPLADADQALVEQAAVFDDELSQFLNLAEQRQTYGIPVSRWWWYLDVVRHVPRRDSMAPALEGKEQDRKPSTTP